jgi:uncharacterized protein YndB with AHSA1/START domain
MSHKVEHNITLAATPERVWRALVEEMNQWWTKPYYNNEEHMTGQHMEQGLGGRYIEDWGDKGEGFLIGTIVEWLPPFLLAHTWTERDWGGVNTLVRLELAPDQHGGTTLKFTHDGFEHVPDSAHQRDEHQHGWGDLIGKLKTYLEKRN